MFHPTMADISSLLSQFTPQWLTDLYFAHSSPHNGWQIFTSLTVTASCNDRTD